MRFWDSSAIVPLVVEQPGSSLADAWLQEDARVVVWTLTETEVVSALRRLVRDGALAEHLAADAELLAVDLLRCTDQVMDIELVKVQARRVLRLHALRAADALQLAAALAWADGRPESLIVHTFDQRLAVAAQREGFTVIPGPPRDQPTPA